MNYLSPKALEIEPYTPGEQPRDRKYIKLNTNENAYPPSPRVKAAISGLTDSLRLYPDPDCGALRAACSLRMCLWATVRTRCWRLRLRRW